MDAVRAIHAMPHAPEAKLLALARGPEAELATQASLVARAEAVLAAVPASVASPVECEAPAGAATVAPALGGAMAMRASALHAPAAVGRQIEAQVALITL